MNEKFKGTLFSATSNIIVRYDTTIECQKMLEKWAATLNGPLIYIIEDTTTDEILFFVREVR